MITTLPCWRCGSKRSQRRELPPRAHTTHYADCDCNVTYAECMNDSACRRRRSDRAVRAPLSFRQAAELKFGEQWGHDDD